MFMWLVTFVFDDDTCYRETLLRDDVFGVMQGIQNGFESESIKAIKIEPLEEVVDI